MSVFRYDSKHKVIIGVIIIIASATGFYLRDHEKPSYKNGQSKQVGSQVDGRNHGQWIWYYPNGRKKMQGRFNGGEREGEWITFSLNGDTITKANYHDDRLNGAYVIFAENKKSNVLYYKNDVLLNN